MMPDASITSEADKKVLNRRNVLLIVIIAQLCGTSLWFAGNAVVPGLQEKFGWDPSSLGYVTSATQLGFIIGTLTFAVRGFADRMSPSRLFMISSFFAGACNLICLIDLSSLTIVATSRILTGFFLAGIYPVGMKIAADWSKKGLGKWLGGLVGALVLGTSLPHLVDHQFQDIDPSKILTMLSLLSVAGGLLTGFFVPDGPYQKRNPSFSFASLKTAFANTEFARSAMGYFGHMWEVYALWTFVPATIAYYQIFSHNATSELLPFFVIASGAAGCIGGGLLAERVGSRAVALGALSVSGICCLLSLTAYSWSPRLFTVFMIVWGITVASDSPQFSALVANNVSPEVKGSAITLVTCIGFAITIVSIQLLAGLQSIVDHRFLLALLFPGPAFGIYAMLWKKQPQI